MNCVVTSEERFGLVNGEIKVHNAAFWNRYLDVFETLTIIARVAKSSDYSGQSITDQRITCIHLPAFIGPRQFVRTYPSTRTILRSKIPPASALISRVPSVIATVALGNPHFGRRPFGLEVVGDPFDVFAPGAIQHPLRRFFRQWFSSRLRQQCQRAAAVTYVTETQLQRRYPPRAGAFTTFYSSIKLPSAYVCDHPRQLSDRPASWHIVTVGSHEQMYKGTDTLIQALATCRQAGIEAHLSIAGAGRYQQFLVNLTQSLGLAEHVRFLGHVEQGAGIRQLLDQADLFVLPSRQEGLPRAMIEAMARAVPCLGSDVGGIPELLAPDELVPADNAEKLAQKMIEVLSSPSRLAALSIRNLDIARRYTDEILSQRRNTFYTYIQEQTERWLAQGGRS